MFGHPLEKARPSVNGWLLTGALDEDDGVVDGDDVLWHEEAPPTWSAGLWCSWCRGGVQGVAGGSFGGDFGDGGAGAGFVDDGLVAGVGGDEGLDGEVVHRAGQAAGDLVDQRGRRRR